MFKKTRLSRFDGTQSRSFFFFFFQDSDLGHNTDIYIYLNLSIYLVDIGYNMWILPNTNERAIMRVETSHHGMI